MEMSGLFLAATGGLLAVAGVRVLGFLNIRRESVEGCGCERVRACVCVNRGLCARLTETERQWGEKNGKKTKTAGPLPTQAS